MFTALFGRDIPVSAITRKHIKQIELIFHKLTKLAEFETKPDRMKKILETPGESGQSLVMSATYYSSIEIIEYLLTNKIKMNSCDSAFQTALFTTIDITSRIINFVNPKIIDHRGESHLYHYS